MKIALRQLRKSPGFTLVAIATLALGIGAFTALFSVINSLLFRPTPVHQLDELVFAISRNQDNHPLLSAPAEYEAWRDHSNAFTSWGAAITGTAVLTGSDTPEQLSLASLDDGYLRTLGVTPLHGRAFTVEETQQQAPVLLLSHAFWQARFGADPAVLGRHLVLDGAPHTVVGVLPPGFDLPRSNQVYRPYAIPAPGTPTRPDRGLFPVARLAPGRTLADADTELKAIHQRLAASDPLHKGGSVNLIPLRHQLLLDIEGDLSRRLLLFGGAVGLLLLVVCANVGNLMLARSLGRAREFAVCAALGASRTRLVRQVLLESGLLALLGGVAGLLLAAWLTPLLAAFNPVEPLALSGLLTTPSFDLRVLLATAGAAALTLLLAGLPAVWSATRVDLNDVLQSGGARGSSRHGGRWRDGLIVGEIALCLALLAAAALLGKSLQRLLDEPLGFEPRHVLAVRVAPSLERYPDQASRTRFAENVLERMRLLPGVRHAGLGTTLPLHLDGWTAAFRPETGPKAASEHASTTLHRLVTPGYLEAMGMTLTRGRLIEATDRADSPRVAVISETLAQRMWPGEDPLGQRVRRLRSPDQLITVVGVVAPVKEDLLHVEESVWYLPYAQFDFTDPVHLVVKSDGDPQLLGRAIADAVHAVDPLQPLFELTELEPYVARFFSPDRFAATLLGGFATVGLLLAALGIYGVNACFVGLRHREIGIRLALGATPRAVGRFVFGHSLRLLAAGVLLGIAGALVAGRVFASLLHDVRPHDTVVFASVTVLLTAVALLATWLPARRATRIDPVEALRAE